MRTYDGHCHCGAIRFRIQSEPITTGIRCNCSICIRLGAVMSTSYFAPDAFERLDDGAALRVYLWGDRMVNHHFCAICGIYPFHDATTAPGHYRVNLGCLDDVDPLALEIRLIDGRSL
jgi:hypothetical protein